MGETVPKKTEEGCMYTIVLLRDSVMYPSFTFFATRKKYL